MTESRNSIDCATLAFYGIEWNPENVQLVYETTLEWFHHHGSAPDRLGVRAPGFSGKAVGFDHAQKKLSKQGFEGVSAIELISDAPEEMGRSRFELTAFMNCEPCGYFVITNFISTDSLDKMLDYFRGKNIFNLLGSKYGIGYTREHYRDPFLWALGMGTGGGCHSDETDDSMRSTSFWGRYAIKDAAWMNGKIRDVFEINFLNESQLKRQVFGMPFEQWVGSASERGKLTRETDSITSWSVPKENLQELKETMAETGLIFHWRDVVEKSEN